MVAILTACTLVRHKREAEIRLLTGAYLSDGIEAARFKMPALFESPFPNSEQDDASDDVEEKSDRFGDITVMDGPLAQFFKDAPERLAEMRKYLPELGRAAAEAERRQTLLKLHEMVCALKNQANCWDLRPVWQLTSALELLVKRLADKCKEATPSTIRTVASAVDLLGELCVPDVRPDLIISPPISVLTVDDDPLCSRAVVFALHKAEMNPDVAETGEQAVALAAEKFYDVIFMDIQMPGIDGMEACTQIHKGEKNKTTPVVFVTVRSDFHTRAQSSLAGGTDLLAKPFLMFEITVKALMFSMRKRLELAESLRREVAGLKGVSALEGIAMISPPPAMPKVAVPTAEPAAANVPAEKLDQDIPKITVKGSCEDAVTIDRRRRKTARRFKHDEQKKRKVLITE